MKKGQNFNPPATDIGPRQIVGNQQLTNKEMQRRLIEAENKIKELSQALEEQRESEEKFKTFFEYANDALIYMDNTGRIVEVNDVTEDIFGWSRKEAKGKHYSEFGLLRPEHFEQEAFKGFDNSMEDVLWPITELEVFRKDGIPIFIEVSTKLVEKNGAAKGLMCIVRDITDRKHMEQALQESEEMARALLNAATDAVMLLDLEGGILDLNTAYADKFDRSIAEIIGLCLWDLISFDAADLKKNIDRVIKTSRSIRFEKEYQGVWMDNVIHPVLDIKGKVSRVAVFSHDTTKRKEAEETLRQHRDHLEKLVKERTANLEQANTALKVLLKRREEDKTELEDKMVLNVKELVLPFL
jgi:PAS domain S-box-containing protein